jgi:hypothetical protein
LFEVGAVGGSGLVVDVLFVFGAEAGSAVEGFSEDVGVACVAGGLAEDVDQDGEEVGVGVGV